MFSEKLFWIAALAPFNLPSSATPFSRRSNRCGFFLALGDQWRRKAFIILPSTICTLGLSPAPSIAPMTWEHPAPRAVPRAKSSSLKGPWSEEASKITLAGSNCPDRYSWTWKWLWSYLRAWIAAVIALYVTAVKEMGMCPLPKIGQRQQLKPLGMKPTTITALPFCVWWMYNILYSCNVCLNGFR